MDDPNDKRLLALSRMAEELLRCTGEDTVWRVRFSGRGLHLLILLEFQSRGDREWRCAADCGGRARVGRGG